jgi:integrase
MRDQRVIHGKITIRSVNALRPGETLKSTELPGFMVRASERGKTYSLVGRIGRGRGAPQLRYTIGPHGAPWTPTTAHSEARWASSEAANGRDPRAKHKKPAAELVADLVRQFMEEEVEGKLKPSTAKAYRQLFDGIVLPAIGRRRAADVTRQDIVKVHHARRATPVRANSMLAATTTLFNFAERIGLRPENSNPCRHVDRYPQRQRERFLSANELARLGEALTAYTGPCHYVAAIKLLVFTGARLGEILGLRWEWIDFDRGEARLPDSKTGAKTVHLPPPALAVLVELPRIEGNPHVIVGKKERAALANLQKPWSKIRKQAGLADVRMHDLRHAFASIAAASGMGLPIIGKMLGHRRAATTDRYAHVAADPVKAAAATVAAKIAAAMSGGKGGGDAATVAKLRRGA